MATPSSCSLGPVPSISRTAEVWWIAIRPCTAPTRLPTLAASGVPWPHPLRLHPWWWGHHGNPTGTVDGPWTVGAMMGAATLNGAGVRIIGREGSLIVIVTVLIPIMIIRGVCIRPGAPNMTGRGLAIATDLGIEMTRGIAMDLVTAMTLVIGMVLEIGMRVVKGMIRGPKQTTSSVMDKCQITSRCWQRQHSSGQWHKTCTAWVPHTCSHDDSAGSERTSCRLCSKMSWCSFSNQEILCCLM